jgi:hypothetical protein
MGRAGASKRAEKRVADPCSFSPQFEAMWHDNDVRTPEGGTKHFNHSDGGAIALDYSAFAVDGQPGLTMMIFTPAAPTDADRVSSLIANSEAPSGGGGPGGEDQRQLRS